MTICMRRLEELRRLPVCRQQRRQFILVGHRRQLREDIAQILEGVFSMAYRSTREDDRVDDGRPLAGVGMAHEEPVLVFSDAKMQNGLIAFLFRDRDHAEMPTRRAAVRASRKTLRATQHDCPASGCFLKTGAILVRV